VSTDHDARIVDKCVDPGVSLSATRDKHGIQRKTAATNLNKIAGESFHGLQVADIANLGEDSVNAFVSHSTLSLVMLNATP
jgi:hypothetical protein